MEEVLQILTPADYTFLLGLVESNVNLTNDTRLRALIEEVTANDTPETRAELNRLLAYEVRYLGSADLAYLFRFMTGQTPGVSFSEIVRDVAKALKVDPPKMGTEREQLEELVEQYATKQFASRTPEEQQQMLVDLGVERDKAAAFVKKSAGVFALPMLIQAFSTIIVEGLIKGIIFGTIAKIIGTQLARRLFSFIAGRFPWWVAWIGPAVWTLSIGWTALDLQGPAMRKTIPVVLYLGLVALRDRGWEDAG